MINFIVFAVIAAVLIIFCMAAGSVLDDRLTGRRNGKLWTVSVAGFSIGAAIFALGFLAGGSL